MPHSKSLVDEAEKSFRSYYPNYYKARSAMGVKKMKYRGKFIYNMISFLKEDYSQNDLEIAIKKAHRSLKP